MNYAEDLDLLGADLDYGPDLVVNAAGTPDMDSEQREFLAASMQAFLRDLGIKERLFPVLDQIMERYRKRMVASAKMLQAHPGVAHETARRMGIATVGPEIAELDTDRGAWIANLAVMMAAEWYWLRFGSLPDFSQLIESAPKAVS